MVTCIAMMAVMAVLCSSHACALELARDGRTDYVVALCDDPIPAEETAARELQEHLKLVTGAELEIVPEAEAGARAIFVGPGVKFGAACPDVDVDALGQDGIVLKTVGETLYLAGGRPRGTLYAAYTFLEGAVGVRWWSSTESFIPENPTLEIPDLDRVYVPKLKCREPFYRDAFEPVFASRLKCNGDHQRIPPEYGGHNRIIGWCHTFFRLLPPDKYSAEHPEWYSEIDGERKADRTQLCLTNEEMRAELTRVALDWIRADPDAGMISISQNDWGGQCQCEKCKAVEEAEGSPSGPLIHFVNAVAEEIEKEFPDFLIETLAYHYTRKAPANVKPRDNVVIRLCSIECNFAEPLATGPTNASFKEDIEAWSKIAAHLYIWNYVTNFANYILPHPNMRGLASDIRFFVDHNAIGLFEQGDSGCSCSDFPELRAWLLAHLMWDPSVDPEALIREFMGGYYGPAAGPLMAYIELIHDAVEREGTYLRCFMSDTSAWLKLDDLDAATELFAKAEAAVADDEALRRRVDRARMPLDHVWLNRWHALRRRARNEGRPFLGPDDPAAEAEEFIVRAQDFNVGNYREGRPFSDYEELLRSRFRPAGPPPKECEGLSEDDWIDIQDNQFRYARLGNWVQIADDEKASDGKAARMPGSHNQWATQYPVPADMQPLNPWHCYVVARCEAKAKEGPAFTIGLYDGASDRGVVQHTEMLEQASDGEYRAYDLGAHDLAHDMYFWIAPPGNAEAVEAVYVDRIFCIRQR